MAIDFDNSVVFPANVIDVIYARLKMLDTRVTVVNRGIRKMDPSLTVGIFPDSWQPVQSSEEFLGEAFTPMSVASLGEYYLQIQTLTKGMDQVVCQRQHLLLSKIVRDTVELDGPLRVALRSLPSVTVLGKTESFKSFKAMTQAYFPLDANGNTFINIGVLRCKITTEQTG